MKRYSLLLYFIVLQIFAFAQTETSTKLVIEGIALNDNGDFAGALKKYDAAIADDPTNDKAFYEKTYTLYSMKRLEDCIDLCEQMTKKFPDSKILKGV